MMNVDEKTLYPQAAVVREHGRMPLFFAACILETVALLLSVVTLFVSGAFGLTSDIASLYQTNTTLMQVLIYVIAGLSVLFTLLSVAGMWLIRFSAWTSKPLRPLGFTLATVSLIADAVLLGIYTVLCGIACIFSFSFLALIMLAVEIYLFVISIREVRFALSLREIAWKGYTVGYRGDTLRIPLLVLLVLGTISQVIQLFGSVGDTLRFSVSAAYLDLGLTFAAIAARICLYIVVSSLIQSLPCYVGKKRSADPQQPTQ